MVIILFTYLLCFCFRDKNGDFRSLPSGKPTDIRFSGGMQPLILPVSRREGNKSVYCMTSVPALYSRKKNDAEAEIVVAIRGRIVVTIGNSAILRIVVPTAAAIHAVGAFYDLLPH